jgi:hypothetical protein
MTSFASEIAKDQRRQRALEFFAEKGTAVQQIKARTELAKQALGEDYLAFLENDNEL